MTVAIVDRATGTAVGTVTISINPSGTDRLVLAFADYWEAGDYYTTATCNGVAMTALSAYQTTPARYRVWYTVAPATGAQNVVITNTLGGGPTIAGVVMALSGVHQTTPLGTPAQANGNSTTATVNVPSTLLSDLILDNLSFFGSSTGITVGAGQTSEAQASSGNSRGAVSSEPGTGGTVTMSWTWTGSCAWAIMAVRVIASTPHLFYLTETPALGSGHYALQLRGTPPSSLTMLAGWTVGTVASGNYSRLRLGAEVAAATFGTTVLPNGRPLNLSNGDCFRTGRYHGRVPAGDWAIEVQVVALTAGGAQDGRLRMRLWRSSNPYGSTAEDTVELTSTYPDPETGVTVTNLAVGSPQTSSIFFTLPAFDLNNEFLFFQFAWEIIGAGAGATADVLLRKGADSYISTPVLPLEIPGFYALFHTGANFLTPNGPRVDISNRLMSYESHRGRADALSGIQAGTLSALFDNDDGTLDPENTASSFYPNLKLKRGLQVLAQLGGVTYARGTVAIDSIAAQPTTLGANAVISGQDLYNRLLKEEVTATYIGGGTDGLRIQEIMEGLLIYGTVIVEEGAFRPPAASLVKAKPLEHIDLLVKAGRGQFWIQANGYPAYWGRHERLNQTSVGVFGAGGDYPIPTPQPVLDDAGLFNRVSVRRSASGANEVQRLTITGSPTGGVVTLGYEGAQAIIGWNSNTTFVQAAIEAMSTIGPGNVAVSTSSTGLPAFPVDITFIGDLALRPLNAMTIVSSVLTGGSGPSAAISTVTNGVDPTQTVLDTASKDDYGEIPFDLEQAAADLLADDAEALNWAQWFAYQHSQPSSRFRVISIDPWVDPANLWPIWLAADIGSVIELTHDLPGTKGMVAERYYVEGISEQVTLEGDPDGTFSWLVSKAEADHGDFWVVGVTDTIGPDLVVGW